MKAATERVRFLVLHSGKRPDETLYVASNLFEAYRIEEAEKRERDQGSPADVFEALVVRAFNIEGVWVKPHVDSAA
jgi:hypothetical protein